MGKKRTFSNFDGETGWSTVGRDSANDKSKGKGKGKGNGGADNSKGKGKGKTEVRNPAFPFAGVQLRGRDREPKWRCTKCGLNDVWANRICCPKCGNSNPTVLSAAAWPPASGGPTPAEAAEAVMQPATADSSAIASQKAKIIRITKLCGD